MKVGRLQSLDAGYLQKTFSSSVIPCAYDEQQRVKSSFQSGQFTRLKSLPSKLQPGEIQAAKLKAICPSGSDPAPIETILRTDLTNSKKFIN
eukprot:gene38659-50779_t